MMTGKNRRYEQSKAALPCLSSPWDQGMAKQCQLCEDTTATLFCKQCNESFCSEVRCLFQ